MARYLQVALAVGLLALSPSVFGRRTRCLLAADVYVAVLRSLATVTGVRVRHLGDVSWHHLVLTSTGLNAAALCLVVPHLRVGTMATVVDLLQVEVWHAAVFTALVPSLSSGS